MKKILLFARDPGGANTLIPLVRPLKKAGYNVKLFGKTMAIDRYRKFGLKSRDLNKHVKYVSINNLRKLLEQEKIDCLITGTSDCEFVEKYFWKAAENLDIPSFAIIDNWMNYAIRFSKYNSSSLDKFNKNKDLFYYPTKIFIMDNFSKKEAINEGLEPSRIIVAGQPYFELIENAAKIVKKKHYHKNLKRSGSDFVITYASEPLSAIFNKKNNTRYSCGYDEKTIFVNIANSLKRVLSKYHLGRKIKLIIKLHPREKSSSYDVLCKKFQTKGLEILTDQTSNSLDIISKSNLILGMKSMFLLEATVLNKPIISIQIGLKGKSDFILAQRKILKPVLTEFKLFKELREIIVNNKLKKYNMKVIKRPSEKILRHIKKYL